MGCEKDSVNAVFSGPWSDGLLSSMNDPALKVEEDDSIVVIKDKYPKAEIHFLILTKEDISDMTELRKEHVPLLQKMESCGKRIAGRHPNHEIRLGFHAIPSMIRLHLHVISQDFNSPCLRTRDHWNSFTTAYFVPVSDVISKLERHGHIKIISWEKETKLLDTPLKCHKCSFEPEDMAQLKKHLITHIKGASVYTY